MKKLIRTYRGLIYVQVGNRFIRKDSIESVTEERISGTRGIELRTVSGMLYGVEPKEAKRVLAELCFNEK